MAKLEILNLLSIWVGRAIRGVSPEISKFDLFFTKSSIKMLANLTMKQITLSFIPGCYFGFTILEESKKKGHEYSKEKIDFLTLLLSFQAEFFGAVWIHYFFFNSRTTIKNHSMKQNRHRLSVYCFHAPASTIIHFKQLKNVKKKKGKVSTRNFLYGENDIKFWWNLNSIFMEMDMSFCLSV